MNRLFALFFIALTFQLSAQQKIVNIQEITSVTVFDTLFYGARLQPKALITHSSPVSGLINKIYVQEGDRVSVGTALCSVERRSVATDFLPMVVTSRINGIVGKVLITDKQEVNERTELITIADISSYKVDLLLSDKDVVRIKKGDSVYIRASGISGVITSYAMIPEGTSGLFRTRAEFKADDRIFPGSFVELEIRVDYYKGVVIPVEWVVSRYGKSLIYMLEDNIVRFKEIEIGKRYGKKVAVVKGIKAGDKAIIKYNKSLFDGDVVEVSTKKEGGRKSGNGMPPATGREGGH